MLSYNGENCVYDALGNPTTYRNHSLTWTNVRRLSSYDGNTFAYGADGIRYRKNNTTYTLDGSRILRETDGDKTLTYYYGNSGVIGFRYNNTDYYYRKNLQGDIIAIYTESGTLVAEYLYDAWGKVLNEDTLTDIGALNPFRYRSYYYDTETGMYYLETRYYDPETGRFINADSLAYLGNGAQLSGYNLFVYCGNNPVIYADPTGCSFVLVCAGVGVIAGAIVGAIVADESDNNIWLGIAIGSIAGGLLGAGIGAGMGIALTGSAVASTSSVISGAGTFATILCSSGIKDGLNYLANNFHSFMNNSTDLTTKAQNVYYQVTSYQAAKDIIETQKLIPSNSEGSVYVLNFQPTLEQAQQLGARAYETVIQFSTNCSTFVKDVTVPFDGAFRNLVDGFVNVYDILEVGFR